MLSDGVTKCKEIGAMGLHKKGGDHATPSQEGLDFWQLLFKPKMGTLPTNAGANFFGLSRVDI